MERICPQPGVWAEIAERLRAEARARGVDTSPPVPLVLSGWTYSNDLEKKERWDETVRWAQANGLESEISASDDEFYAVVEPYEGMVGPGGGPMYLRWRFDAVPRPATHLLDERLAELTLEWRSIEPAAVTEATEPVRFTGKKARRLEVRVLDRAFQPPWGSWRFLAPGPERRTFTHFRASINKRLAPHSIDHIGFVGFAD